jgi:hypothetical protein
MLHSPACGAARRRDRRDDAWRQYRSLQDAHEQLLRCGLIVDECHRCQFLMHVDAGLITVVEIDTASLLSLGERPRRRLPAERVTYRECGGCRRIIVLRNTRGRPPGRCGSCAGREVKREIAVATLDELGAIWSAPPSVER